MKNITLEAAKEIKAEIDALVADMEAREVEVKNKVARLREKITLTNLSIDCDAEPFCPNNLRIYSHNKRGQLQICLNDIVSYVSERQVGCRPVNGYKIWDELEKSSDTLNANVLEFMLANQHFIPSKIAHHGITCFWGTIYTNAKDLFPYPNDMFVRYFLHGKEGFKKLDGPWWADISAAMYVCR